MEPIRDQRQPKSVEGEQKVLLDERITAETDELDPKFDSETENSEVLPDESHIDSDQEP